MPELPEVETVVRGLQNSLVGRTIGTVEVLWTRTIAGCAPQAFAGRLLDRRFLHVRRRGKWIHLELDGDEHLLIHLRMSGRLRVEPADAPVDRHARVIFSLDEGLRLRFSDQRKFGRIILTGDPEEILGDLGPEPLGEDFTVARLAQMLARRRGRLKPLLLNQRFIAGLGNIYTDEALWRARIHPLRRADMLSEREVARLHEAIRVVLSEAVVAEGTTLDDFGYVGVNGQPGEFATRLAVYGRAGEPCPRCDAPIDRIKVSQRGTSLCPRCQPLPDDFKL
jgi:formamidopyrimidine-DNA glycosylase